MKVNSKRALYQYEVQLQSKNASLDRQQDHRFDDNTKRATQTRDEGDSKQSFAEVLRMISKQPHST